MLASTSVPDRLKQAISDGLVPDNSLESAKRVLDRLNRALRVTVLGFPGTGKSTLVNLLAGETIIASDVSLPPVLLEHGDVSQTICVLPDGEKKLDGVKLSEAVELSPALIKVQTSLAALTKISILDVSAPSESLQQRRAIAWACKRSDVVIWCSQAFGADEQALWSEVPDHLKDHAILALTKTDLLGSPEAIEMHLSSVRNVAQDEFYFLTALSAQSARNAKTDDSSLDLDAFKASGATGLISTLKSQVERGRRADLDYAQMLVEKHAGDDALVAEVPVTFKPRKQAEPSSEQPDESAEQGVDASQLRSILEDRISTLKEQYGSASDIAAAEILSQCQETLESLTSELGATKSPPLAQISDNISEAQDLLMLMQLEDESSAAEESLTILLQLRRDLGAITLH